jgi:formamidopyrimidine-DNA glycosylase
MAELPELEIFRRDLDKELSGKKVKTAEVTVPAAVKRNTNRKGFATRVEGAKFGSVRRHGPLLVADLDTGDVLCISLGHRGRVVRAQNKEAAPKGIAVTLTFTQHGCIRMIDPGKTSEMWVTTPDAVAGEIGPLGLDLVEEPVSWTHFGELLLRRTGKLKSILMDQTFLVGIGPVYSDEILFDSGLRYDRTPQTLSTQEIRRLFRSTVEILHEAIKYNGTSLEPDGFVDLFGKPGTYQDHLAVYGRDGQMTPRARGPVMKTRFGSGFTYYCAQTQM